MSTPSDTPQDETNVPNRPSVTSPPSVESQRQTAASPPPPRRTATSRKWYVLLLAIAGTIASIVFYHRTLDGPERQFGKLILREVVADDISGLLRQQPTPSNSFQILNLKFNKTLRFNSPSDETFTDSGPSGIPGRRFGLSSYVVIYLYDASIRFGSGETKTVNNAIAFRKIDGQPMYSNTDGWATCRVPKP